jgi:hypothetical protein
VSLITIPYTFVAGTEAISAQVNANFSEIATVVNGELDNTNINSSVGIYASQIIPTSTVQATFGGAYGYVIAPGVTTQVPLTISGITSQNVDLFDIYLTSGGSKDFWITSSGNMHIASGITFNAPLTSPSNAAVALANDNAATGGLILNVPTGSTNGFQFQTAGSTVASIAASGAVATGALTVTGQIKATTSIVAGSATAGTATAGDVWASRTASTGALQVGGSIANAQIDYGITTNGTLTINAPFTATGSSTFPGGITATGAQVQAAGYTATGTAVSLFEGGIQPGRNGTYPPGGPALYGGNGAPSFSAGNGSIYLRYDGGAAARWYLNTTGASTTGTTWTALAD